MINPNQIELLKRNWGEKADALDCFAYVRLFDHLSNWQCYLFAISDDELVAKAAFHTPALGLQIDTITIQELSTMYNSEGEAPLIDEEFRPQHITRIIKRLKRD